LSYIQAIILGIVQGLTEFLPVSSSGHLELGKAILGDTSLPQDSLLFTVVVHFSTALATLIVFRKEVLEICKGLVQFRWNKEFEFSLKIIVSMFPAGLIGLLFIEEIEQLFDRQILLVGVMLILTGALLLIADKATDTQGEVSYSKALMIGIAQAVAILPGISRSGATISTSVLLGIDRTRAASFSFLMVVPLIIAKIAKDLLDGALVVEGESVGVMATGFVAAFITGLIACSWMIRLVKNAQLKYFSYYCFIVGAGACLYQLLS
jgi:undecaprenyl-diphosphatase